MVAGLAGQLRGPNGTLKLSHKSCTRRPRCRPNIETADCPCGVEALSHTKSIGWKAHDSTISVHTCAVTIDKTQSKNPVRQLARHIPAAIVDYCRILELLLKLVLCSTLSPVCKRKNESSGQRHDSDHH